MTKLGLKIVAVIAITIGLLIPLTLIRGLIQERTQYRDEARADIAGSWTGEQAVVGPVLVVPGRSPDTDEGRQRPCLYLFPKTVEIQASLRTETRRRGLYSVPVYYTQLEIAGEFDLSTARPLGGATWDDLDLDAAYVSFSLSDNRGIVGQPELVWAGETTELLTGSRLPSPGDGVHAEVGPLVVEPSPPYPFRMEVELRGMETLQFAPIGGETHVVMDAEWSHPSFIGRFLPVEREIEGERFSAEWRVSGLARGLQPVAGSPGLLANAFGVSLINPVDIYQQAMRSVKYGNLIVLLTFTAFFLVEMVRRLMLHPMQYLLVGLALVIFFLLLLALSEHMVFTLAYCVAAAACIALVAIYMASAMRSTANGAGVAATLGALYAMLYVILKSEDNALLMGSVLLFSALAALMMVTRRIDWYRLGQQFQPTSSTDHPDSQRVG